MAVLERKLDRHTEGIAVLRAMAVSAQPARRRLVECGQEFGRTEAVKALGRLVVHEAPRQHPGIVPIVAGGEPVARRGTLGRRFRRETGAQQGRLVHHLAPGAELHRPIRIAFARRKRIAERHDEEVVDHHLRVGELAPIGQLDRHRDAGLGTIERVGHTRDGELVRAGHALALGFASGLARLPAPSALAVRAAKLLGRDPDRDRVRLGPNVIFWGIMQLALIFRAFCRCLLPFCYQMPRP